MSDIFISYAKEDRAMAEKLAGALETTGWSVFWDHEIPPGSTWRDYIGKELDQTRCMVVVWSKISVVSDWVLEEAEIGRGRHILVPVRIDDVMPPLGFQSLQAADLSQWDGTPEDSAFKSLVAAIESKLGPAPGVEEEPAEVDVASTENPDEDYTEGPTVAMKAQPPEVEPSEPEHKRFPWWIVAVSAAVLLIVGVGAWWAVRQPSKPLDPEWLGEWLNIDPNEQSIARLEIQQDDSNIITVRAWKVEDLFDLGNAAEVRQTKEGIEAEWNKGSIPRKIELRSDKKELTAVTPYGKSSGTSSEDRFCKPPPVPEWMLERIRKIVEGASIEYTINASAEEKFYSNIVVGSVLSDHVVCSCNGRVKSSVNLENATIDIKKKADGYYVLIHFKSGAVRVSGPEKVECTLESRGGHPLAKPVTDGQKNKVKNDARHKLGEEAFKKKEEIVKKTTEKAKASITEFAGKLGYQATIVFDEPVRDDSPSS